MNRPEVSAGNARTDKDGRTVLFAAVLTRTLYLVSLLWLSGRIPSWDKSAEALLQRQNFWMKGFLRWDTIYFARIARQGYTREQEFAFMPGLPLLMRLTSHALSFRDSTAFGGLTTEDVLLGGTLCAYVAGILAVIAFYRLSLNVLNDERTARNAALLYCVLPSPSTSVVPYNEPFFALFAFNGMRCLEEDASLLAAVSFACATSFRANGILNAGFFLWQTCFARPKSVTMMRIIRCLLCISLTLAPFAAMQYWAYTLFCDELERPWCRNTFPMIYPFVQSHYWEVGLFRYWTLLQLPNFIISIPVMMISMAAAYTYYTHDTVSKILRSIPFSNASQPIKIQGQFQSNTALLPYMHLHVLTMTLLLFASHVQICLRQAATNPIIFWYAAHLFATANKYGRYWLFYCVGWGALSLVLWAGFYPPA